ncbi:MliC family protein [Chachezhania sediminis]|uniref:MliC family protein n=1 Tax=Chachezhania sediminis TaxID=2599291 RepID=UPI00131D8FD1|nr:MliC family protein [Chachezhania sediminis]
MKHLALIAAATLAAASPALAQVDGPTVTISLDLQPPVNVIPTDYDCGDAGTLSATYVNADLNELVVLELEDSTLLLTSAISASGARYTAGVYEWWVKGDEATMRNQIAAEDADPILTCKALADE